MNPDVKGQIRLGPILLAPGATRGQVFIFLAVVIAALCMLLFLPMMQAFVFNDMLHVPKGEQGKMAGNLSTVQQIAVLIFVGISGGLADRIGRKAILVIALLGYSVCLFLYPLAGGLAMLFAIQFIFGMFSTGHTIGGSTFIVDFPDNQSRGKFLSLMLIVQGLGSALLVGYVGARLPGWLVQSGQDPSLAGRYAFWGMAGLGLLGALIAIFALRNVRAPQSYASSPPEPGAPVAQPTRSQRVMAAIRTMRSNYKRVFLHARDNPRFGLVMLMGFVIRSDYTVINSFLALWVTHAAGAQGITSANALKTAGGLFAIFQVSSLVAPLLFGFLADRMNRTLLLILALAFTGCTLMSTMLISDVFGFPIMVVVGLIGVSETALIIGAQSVFGEEVQADLRGSATGIFAFLGTFSVVIIAFIGGRLFDSVGYSAPFALVGSLNVMFAIIGAVLVWRAYRPRLRATNAPAPVAP